MIKEPIMIDENICDYYSDTKEDEEGANPVVGWCFDNNCKCEDIPFDECVVKAVQYCKLKDKQLNRKHQQMAELKDEIFHLREKVNKSCVYCIDLIEKKQQLYQLKAENEKMSKGYIELTEIVSPYIDDFTGYNEELKGFDIVLCVKELMQQLDQFKAENEHLSEKEEESKHYLEETKKFKSCLTEIKEIAEICSFADSSELLLKRIKQILREIKEVLKDVK